MTIFRIFRFLLYFLPIIAILFLLLGKHRRRTLHRAVSLAAVVLLATAIAVLAIRVFP